MGAMANASLALLAFLLAFTFGFAASRVEARRTLMLDEVNAIGTTYLRTGTLPEAERAQPRALLREYADTRLAAARSREIDVEIRRSVELQRRLWEQAAALAERQPSSIVVGLYLQALNETIDLHTKRVTETLRLRVPGIIWLVLYAITALAMAEMGYQTGLGGLRRPLSTPALASRSPAGAASAATLLMRRAARSPNGRRNPSPGAKESSRSQPGTARPAPGADPSRVGL